MAHSNHGKSRCPGLDRLMEFDFARQERCAAGSCHLRHEITAAAANDADQTRLSLSLAYDLHGERIEAGSDVAGE